MEGSDLAELYYQGLSNKVNILIFFFISFLCTLYSLKNIYIYIYFKSLKQLFSRRTSDSCFRMDGRSIMMDGVPERN